MSAQTVAIVVLLVLGIGTVLLSCALLPFLPSSYDRVHALGPASIVGAALIGAAVITHEAMSPAGVKTVMIVLFFWLSSPVLAHATMRAVLLRERGLGKPMDDIPPVDG